MTQILIISLGTYVLRDDLHLATPPPHPSEAPTTNLNPLATTMAPPIAGVRLSLTTISPRRTVPQLYQVNSTSTRSSLVTYSIKESEKESRGSYESGTNGSTVQEPSTGTTGKAPAFGADNALLAVTGAKESLKRRKPKNNIVKSNSSFVSRVIPHEAMSKRLQERNVEGLFAFANINRAFQWLDFSSNNSSKVEAQSVL